MKSSTPFQLVSMGLLLEGHLVLILPRKYFQEPAIPGEGYGSSGWNVEEAWKAQNVGLPSDLCPFLFSLSLFNMPLNKTYRRNTFVNLNVACFPKTFENFPLSKSQLGPIPGREERSVQMLQIRSLDQPEQGFHSSLEWKRKWIRMRERKFISWRIRHFWEKWTKLNFTPEGHPNIMREKSQSMFEILAGIVVFFFLVLYLSSISFTHTVETVANGNICNYFFLFLPDYIQPF